jgi:hypothetical protein
LNPGTDQAKLILRGIKRDQCTDLNVPNRRVYCCNTHNCNKHLPPMIVSIRAKMVSSNQRHVSSIILIMFAITFQQWRI